jgi:adenylosuccinate synthase
MIEKLKLRGRSALTKEMRQYIAHIEKSLGIPISAVGLGRERDRTIVLRDIWPK